MGKASALWLIESVKTLRVAFVGDTIVDEYHYVNPLGKSPKEHMVPVQYHSKEVFEGGVQAAANHARTFCEKVSVITGGPTTRKVRYIDQTYLRKLFEVQYQDAPQLSSEVIGEWDVVIYTDFGHGACDYINIETLLPDVRPWITVNAQTNAANIGYNLITKYDWADYIVIDEPEARLAAADRTSPIEKVISKLAEGRCQKMIVTQGTQGATGFDGSRFVHVPAMAKTVVDTMGAGDAFYAVTAPMSVHGDIEDLLIIGNAAGALKCGIVGHRASVTKADLIQYLEGLE